MVNVCGGCLPHAGCCLQHLCQLINSLQNWYPPRLRTSIAHFRQGSCRVGQGLPQVCGRAGLAGLGPRSLAPRCVLPCGSALGVGPSPWRSAPAPGQPRSPPSTCMTPDTGHTGEVRVGGERGCWPEEPGRSQGWLCAGPAGLGPRSLAPRCMLPCGSARGVGPSSQHSAPAPGWPWSPPSTCMTPDTGHTGEVRVGWEGGCWPEEPGRSRGWLCAERPGVRQGEAASLGQSSAAHRCVWRWGARRGPRAPASCSHP